jgi:hypothetical protein
MTPYQPNLSLLDAFPLYILLQSEAKQSKISHCKKKHVAETAVLTCLLSLSLYLLSKVRCCSLIYNKADSETKKTYHTKLGK